MHKVVVTLNDVEKQSQRFSNFRLVNKTPYLLKDPNLTGAIDIVLNTITLTLRSFTVDEKLPNGEQQRKVFALLNKLSSMVGSVTTLSQ